MFFFTKKLITALLLPPTGALLLSMAGIAALTLVAITWLPSHARTAAALMPVTPEAPPQSPRAAD